MKDSYPSYDSLSADYLVPPALQPDYLDLPGVQIDDRDNLGLRLISGGRLDAIAIIHHEAGRACTFGELGRESARLANALRAKGIRPGDRVALRSSNRPEAVISAIAAWRLGAVIVPTPPQARAAELRFLLEDTEPRVLITDAREGYIEAVEPALAGTTVEHVISFGAEPPSARFDRWSDLCAQASEELPAQPVSSRSVAIVWHTGGTTGVPKACYHTQRRLMLAGYSLKGAIAVGPGQRWAAAAPVGHALGFIYHTIYTLLHGATVVMVEGFAEPETLLQAIAMHRIETFTAISATWARMLDAIAADRTLDRVQSIRRGYAMWQSASSSEVRDGWIERGIDLMNNFGSTSFATWVLVPRQGERFPAASLGRAAPGYVIEATDPDLNQVRPLARDDTGRMAVKGPTGLTYWRRPEYQERDVVDGWTLQDDLIRIGSDGNATYLGRTDFMISTAGHKVAPVEVEEAIARHPAVREVGVVGGPDPVRQEIVTAFVVLNDGFAPSDGLKRELQDHVKATLAPHKYPRRIEFIDALPRDPVGKVQPRALKAMASLDRSKASTTSA